MVHQISEFNGTLKERYEILMGKALKYAYEKNPNYSDFNEKTEDLAEYKITKDVSTKDYYCHTIYLNKLPTGLYDEIWGVIEALPIWIDTYLSGKTSLYNMVNYYTSEQLENRIIWAEGVVEKIMIYRENFIKEQI
jgi:hypothetical protein